MNYMRTALLSLATAVAGFAADPALLRMIPANSPFLAGIHADQIKTSRFGQFLLNQLKSEEANMNKFIDATGFDPRRDLTELIVASSDASGKGKSVVVARGRFDTNRINAFASTGGAKLTTYNGVQVMSGGTEGGKSGWLAVLDNVTAVAGDQDSVRSAIDRYKGAPGALDAATLARINELSSRYDAWMISNGVARIADDIRNPQVGGMMNNNLFQSMQSVMGGVRFGTNVELTAEATMRSEKDATAMVDVIRFLAGMLQMNSQNDKRAAELATLLDKMQLSSSGTQFKLSLTIPEETLEGIVKPVSSGAKAKVTVI
ncbi:MAG: hypothetical protein JST93_29150 [Acidobacteria bacterium]|nr:hypothetical protein [Acidobacteriota bacterium]